MNIGKKFIGVCILLIALVGVFLLFGYKNSKDQIEIQPTRQPATQTELATVPQITKSEKILSISQNKEYLNYIYNVLVSNDGRRIAYTISDDKGRHFLAYEVLQNEPYFDLAVREETYRKRYITSSSWEETGPYTFVSNVVFSPDLKRYGYSFFTSMSKSFPDPQIGTMVIDGIKYGPYKTVGDYIFHAPVFSADSQHVVFNAGLDVGGSKLILDGKEQPNSTGGRDITFIPGNELAYILSLTNEIVVGKERYRVNGDVNNLFISPDGKHVAYFLYDGDLILFVDDKNYGAVNSTPEFSLDNEHFSYIDKAGKPMVDGNEYEYDPKCPLNFYCRISHVYLSNDGGRVALLQGISDIDDNFRSRLIIDREPTEFYSDNERISDFVFSLDNKHFAYRIGDKVILDGNELGGYDKAYTAPIFSADNKYLYFVARIGGEFWRIVEEISEQ